MNHLEKIRQLLLDSADHIDEHGHHQFDMWEGKACCIMGAARMIDNESSYSHIVRDILASMGYDEAWNDKPERTKQQVVKALVHSTTLVNQQRMQAIYGHHWQQTVDLIVDVDGWTPHDYAELERQSLSVVYAPGEAPKETQYQNGLAGFLATVMTSGHSINSIPYKNYFDHHYLQWTAT